MYPKVVSLLLIFSLALNFAFGGVWIYHTFYVTPRLQRAKERARENRAGGWLAASRLKLDENQRRKLREQRRQFRGELAETRDQIRAQREQLLRLLNAPEPDREAISQCQGHISMLQRKVQRSTVEHLLAVRAELNPAQRKALVGLIRRGMDRSLHHRPSHIQGHRSRSMKPGSGREKGNCM